METKLAKVLATERSVCLTDGCVISIGEVQKEEWLDRSKRELPNDEYCKRKRGLPRAINLAEVK